MSLRDRAKQVLRMCGHALTSTVHDRLDVVERELQAHKIELQQAKLPETHAALLQGSIHIVENLHALAGRTIVETEPSHISAEAALMAFLYSHVPARAAIETLTESANGTRERNAALLRAGYEVYALEAGQGAGRQLVAGTNGEVGRVSGSSKMLSVSGISGVAIETLAARGGADIPDEIGLMTLGCDPLAVLREFGDRRACVITAELQSDFEELVGEMRSREYHWHIVLYRTVGAGPDAGAAHEINHDDRNGSVHAGRMEDGSVMSYYANHPGVLPNSRGSVFLFRDYRVFTEAQAWCAATLPRTYFKPREA